ncbi:MAG: hypothetical protein ACR2OF_08990 [Hyphomicrobium sp.]
MDTDNWVVAAKVGESVPATRTDSCGDMEQLELMELIPLSEHNTKEAAESAAAARRAHNDGWVYSVLSRRDHDARTQIAGSVRPMKGPREELILPQASRPLF